MLITGRCGTQRDIFSQQISKQKFNKKLFNLKNLNMDVRQEN